MMYRLSVHAVERFRERFVPDSSPDEAARLLEKHVRRALLVHNGAGGRELLLASFDALALLKGSTVVTVLPRFEGVTTTEAERVAARTIRRPPVLVEPPPPPEPWDGVATPLVNLPGIERTMREWTDAVLRRLLLKRLQAEEARAKNHRLAAHVSATATAQKKKVDKQVAGLLVHIKMQDERIDAFKNALREVLQRETLSTATVDAVAARLASCNCNPREAGFVWAGAVPPHWTHKERDDS